MIHLVFGGVLWCDADGDEEITITEDPRDPTCLECLKRASSYGAATAMRYAAVEAGATRDPELIKERDEAMRQLNEIQRAVNRQGGFFCNACGRIRALSDRALATNDVAWCLACAPHGKVPS